MKCYLCKQVMKDGEGGNPLICPECLSDSNSYFVIAVRKRNDLPDSQINENYVHAVLERGSWLDVQFIKSVSGDNVGIHEAESITNAGTMYDIRLSLQERGESNG